MKKTIVIIFLLLAVAISSSELSAQNYTSIQYSVGVPLGALQDHVEKVSARGVNFEFHSEINAQITLGVNLGYNVYYERKDYASYTINNATLSGVQYRYDNVFPMLVNAHYNFSTGTIIPYVGLGLGTLYNLRNTNMGVYEFEQNNWHFLVSPEAGAMFDLSPYTRIKLNVKYDQAFKTKSADAMGNLTFNVGFVFVSF